MLLYISLNHKSAYSVIQKILTHVKQVVQSGPAFCNFSQSNSPVNIYQNNAPINVKTRNLTVTYISRVGILIGHHAFLLSISNSRREENHLLLIPLTITFCQGGDFDKIFLKMSKSPPYARHPPPRHLGLDTDRCITNVKVGKLPCFSVY